MSRWPSLVVCLALLASAGCSPAKSSGGMHGVIDTDKTIGNILGPEL